MGKIGRTAAVAENAPISEHNSTALSLSLSLLLAFAALVYNGRGNEHSNRLGCLGCRSLPPLGASHHRGIMITPTGSAVVQLPSFLCVAGRVSARAFPQYLIHNQNFPLPPRSL